MSELERAGVPKITSQTTIGFEVAFELPAFNMTSDLPPRRTTGDGRRELFVLTASDPQGQRQGFVVDLDGARGAVLSHVNQPSDAAQPSDLLDGVVLEVGRPGVFHSRTRGTVVTAPIEQIVFDPGEYVDARRLLDLRLSPQIPEHWNGLGNAFRRHLRRTPDLLHRYSPQFLVFADSRFATGERATAAELVEEVHPTELVAANNLLPGTPGRLEMLVVETRGNIYIFDMRTPGSIERFDNKNWVTKGQRLSLNGTQESITPGNRMIVDMAMIMGSSTLRSSPVQQILEVHETPLTAREFDALNRFGLAHAPPEVSEIVRRQQRRSAPRIESGSRLLPGLD